MKINNLQVIGETKLFEDCAVHGGFLKLNWEGHIVKVLLNGPTKSNWYETINKGGIPIYGFDGEGNITCGCVLLRRGEQDETGKTYCNDVVYVMKANRTDDYGWGVVGVHSQPQTE